MSGTTQENTPSEQPAAPANPTAAPANPTTAPANQPAAPADPASANPPTPPAASAAPVSANQTANPPTPPAAPTDPPTPPDDDPDDNPEAPPPDKGPNQITRDGKIWASALLIFFTIVPIYILIAYWPDRQPAPKDRIQPLYICEAFHVRLAGIPDTIMCCGDSVQSVVIAPAAATGDTTTKTDSNTVKSGNTAKTGNAGKNPGNGKNADTAKNGKGNTATTANTAATGAGTNTSAANTGAGTAATANTANTTNGAGAEKVRQTVKTYRLSDYVHLNSLLLLLIAAAGFAGNMIHIATSFTTWIGLNKFRRRWIPWYFIRPFTAAALAIGIYFVFRAGLLNMSSDADNINLYGVIALSILTGLYTDRATKKMGEVVDTLFRTKDDRSDQAQGTVENKAGQGGK